MAVGGIENVFSGTTTATTVFTNGELNLFDGAVASLRPLSAVAW